eukprot:NODE_1082_length_1479_cov_47.656065_g1071_i0.p1 GENE.NODE_1082_length_1479_cov_47.656065_g1071_i0~~NODE_1082_length_1479_cov_47.656065_g1071_i0.p1  ORF type:complete len:454 (-),score=88.23 NODE_1082_length_1479_cov_47.656065_g1071_i0:118-1338(-)
MGDTIAEFDMYGLAAVGQNGVGIATARRWMYYRASQGTPETPKAGGTYMLRVNSTTRYPVGNPEMQLAVGEHTAEVYLNYDNWVYEVVRIDKGGVGVEIEYTVGAVPIDDGWGKEVFSLMQSNVTSGDKWYTDSNGREMQERVRNYRKYWNFSNTEPVGGNYAPITTSAYIRDDHLQLTLLTETAQGCASLASGEMEVLVHRRLLYDDTEGVGEPLNETQFVTGYSNNCPAMGCGHHYGPGLITRGRHWLLPAHADTASVFWRPAQDAVFAKPLWSVSAGCDQPYEQYPRVLARNLPEAVQLITYEQWNATYFLARFAHQFPAGEGTAVVVDLRASFARFVVEAVEMSLTVNQRRADMPQLQWRTAADDEDSGVHETPRRRSQLNDDLTITLQPLHVVTLLVHYSF